MEQNLQMKDEKTSKILELFFNNISKGFHVRQIAKLIGISAATVSRRLKELIKMQILKVIREEPIFEVKANLDSQDFIEAKKEYNIKNIKNSGLLDYIIKVYNHPETIVLFGSYAKGEDNEKSDVDIAVITNKKMGIDLDKFERKLNRKVHIIEIIQSETKAELMNNLINGVILYGYLKIK